MPSRRSMLKLSSSVLFAGFWLFGQAVAAQSNEAMLSIMPLPAHAVQGQGSFSIDNGFEVVFTGYTELRLERARLRFFEVLKNQTGIRLWAPSAKALPQFVINTKAESLPLQQVGEDEAYRLEVTPEKVTLSAPNPLGVLHGLQTFLQLVQNTPQGFAVASVVIDDAPRFPWRGLMIDTGRHFMPPSVIRQNIDGMEAVKLNVLHWHVSEDQGFRIESKVFPKLQGRGSDGEFYTQDEIRNIVVYARDRGIRVYAEFDMPSHANSFYVGYPELADGPGPYHLKRRFGEKWGRPRKAAEDSSMDPTKESTYQFLDKFIGEMSGLFPDAYFHLGGDAEDAMTEWATNAGVKKYMTEHQVKDPAALLVYFTDRVHKILVKHHKIQIGWDEVLTPSTPKDIVIQSWRGIDSLASAVKDGHPGILSWGYYLDLNEPASRHYAVDPLEGATGSLTPEQQKLILGGETNMWAEYVSPETVGGRVWPRTAAVAERFWSPQDTKDTDSMYARLALLSQKLPYWGLNFKATRDAGLQRLVGSSDVTSLLVLASVMEPPQGFPREGERDYDIYTSLNHLSDVISAESDRGREFRKLAERIAGGSASPVDWQQAREWLMLWRDNDAVLQPILTQFALTSELVPVSHNLKEASLIGLAALDALQGHSRVSAAKQSEDLLSLKAFGASKAELRNTMVPGVETLVKATKP